MQSLEEHEQEQEQEQEQEEDLMDREVLREDSNLDISLEITDVDVDVNVGGGKSAGDLADSAELLLDHDCDDSVFSSEQQDQEHSQHRLFAKRTQSASEVRYAKYNYFTSKFTSK